MPHLPSRRAASLVAILAGLLTSAGWSPVAHAETASPWNEHLKSRVRLIAGEGRMLGIELQLAPGWKTYWRMPGDAGVPPAFDWSGSKNLKHATVLYPVPKAMPDAAGIAVGYQGSVIFPARVSLEKEGQPLRVVVELNFGVCKDICIPVDSKLTLDLGGTAPWPPSAAIQAHLARVPRVAADVASAAPLLGSVKQDAPGGKARLVIETANATAVFLEAPDGLFVPMATPMGGGRFEVDLAASPDLKDLLGKTLRITAATEDGGVETTFLLR